MTFESFALVFHDEREAELVAEALNQLRCDNAVDQLRCAKMTKLIDDELQGGSRE